MPQPSNSDATEQWDVCMYPACNFRCRVICLSHDTSCSCCLVNLQSVGQADVSSNSWLDSFNAKYLKLKREISQTQVVCHTKIALVRGGVWICTAPVQDSENSNSHVDDATARRKKLA